VRDSLERGTQLHFLQSIVGPTAEADANTQQAFVDILGNDVIKPLEVLKVSEAPSVSAEALY
jgi:hypothetical protein